MNRWHSFTDDELRDIRLAFQADDGGGHEIVHQINAEMGRRYPPKRTITVTRRETIAKGHEEEEGF